MVFLVMEFYFIFFLKMKGEKTRNSPFLYIKIEQIAYKIEQIAFLIILSKIYALTRIFNNHFAYYCISLQMSLIFYSFWYVNFRGVIR